jgi:hypothetical protein
VNITLCGDILPLLESTRRRDVLNALAFELAPPKEIAIVGENAQPLLDVVFGEYRPNQVVAWKRDGQEGGKWNECPQMFPRAKTDTALRHFYVARELCIVRQ